MSAFDAICHALTSIATGGMSTRDASFADFKGATEYVATAMMLIASLPFVLYVQMLAAQFMPLLRNAQLRGYFSVILTSVAALTAFRILSEDIALEQAFRETLFNVTSIISGTGYASADYQQWGSFAVMAFFLLGLIGGCAGSTSCSIKIFRYQILFAAIKAQINQIHSPRGVFTMRYEGRPVGEDVVSSVMSFFVLFIVTMGLLAVALAMTGLDMTTSVSGAAAAIANIGPGLGDIIGPTGNYGPLNDTAKWLLAAGMLIGRLELLAVFTLLSFYFWRA